MKKIYISLPIANVEDSVYKRYNEAVEYIKTHPSYFKDYQIVGPIDIEEFETYTNENNSVHDYAWYMGEDIKILLRSDAILMCNGWEKSKGCVAEFNIAKIYNLNIYYMPL